MPHGRGARGWGGGGGGATSVLTHSAPPGPQVGPGVLGGRCARAPPEHVPGLSWVRQAPTPPPARGTDVCTRVRRVGHGGRRTRWPRHRAAHATRATRRGPGPRQDVPQQERKENILHVRRRQITVVGRGVLKRETKKRKKFPYTVFPKKPRVAHMFNHGWWRLAVGSWQLAVGGGWWWLAAVGGW